MSASTTPCHGAHRAHGIGQRSTGDLPQFFPGGQPPALMNPRLAQGTTMLCNDAYAVLASGVTRGPIWSAEHPTASSLATAKETVRERQFHPDDRLPPADQSQLDDYRRSGF